MNCRCGLALILLVVLGMEDRQLWYIRQHGKVAGPYPAGLIRRFMLLQRISESDEISHDGELWVHLSSRAELIPEVIKADRDDPLAQERLSKARRWADERSMEDRRTFEERGGEITTGQRAHTDRRATEAEPDTVAREVHRNRVPGKEQTRDGYFLGGTFILAVMAAVGSYLVYYQPQPPEDVADCNAVAAPRVNWGSCRMEGISLARTDLTGAKLSGGDFSGGDFHGSVMTGADLSYAVMSIADFRGANLSGGNLKGISLRRADLANANLAGADLSYADLQGANLTGVTLDGAILDNAIWVDQSVCTPGSIGQCLIATSRN